MPGPSAWTTSVAVVESAAGGRENVSPVRPSSRRSVRSTARRRRASAKPRNATVNVVSSARRPLRHSSAAGAGEKEGGGRGRAGERPAGGRPRGEGEGSTFGKPTP